MKPKVTFVSSVPLSEPVIRNRLLPFVSGFHDKKYEIVLVCPASNFKLKNFPIKFELKGVNLSNNKPKGFVKRAFVEILDVFKLLRQASKTNSDIYLLTAPSMFLIFLAPLLLYKKKVFLDVRDLSWEYLSNDNLIEKTAKNVFRLLFKCTVSFYQHISATNPTEINYIAAICGVKGVTKVTNGITLSQYNKLKKLPVTQSQQFTVSYIGNLGLAQNLETLIEAAKELPDIRFNIVGSGIEEKHLKGLVEKYSLKNINLPGKVSWNEVLKYYSESDVLYAQLAPEYASAVPSKLYEYLATGKWVLYGGEGQAVEHLKIFEGCTVVKPCSVNELTLKIKELKTKKPKNFYSKKNRKIIQDNYIRENAVKKYLNELADLLQVK